ncbi:hypothetical protein [Luteithermobacter gelatinilyticus]|uniref:hypothetical protein n=1 Tax=Luteithermobacter gelatinilyticus TaxID=2582913 RepID=UPI001106815A|nr:hypothetical protein [Luteithermobacter gelatinilyticus]|tara:strand:+ start:3288 stop:3560 length:273 start_codon:yes stop_codon:yes gene_type:complete
MGVFEMVVLIVLISVIGGIIGKWIKARESGARFDLDELAHDLGLDDGYYDKKKLQPYLDRIEKLEERVRVLERIVTDKSHNLSQEIDKLK